MTTKSYKFLLLLVVLGNPHVIFGMSRREVFARMGARGICAAPQPIKRPKNAKQTLQELAAGIWGNTRDGRFYANKSDEDVAAYFGCTAFFVAYCRGLPISPWQYFDESAYEKARLDNEAAQRAAEPARRLCSTYDDDDSSIHSDDEPLPILITPPPIVHNFSRVEPKITEESGETIDDADSSDSYSADDEDYGEVKEEIQERRKSSQGVRLTEAQRAEVQVLCSKGLYSYQQIADQVQCSLRTVYNIVKKYKQTGVASKILCKKIKKHRPRLTNAQHADIMSFYKDKQGNNNVYTIAKLVGCDPSTVYRYLKAQGFKCRFSSNRAEKLF